MSKATRSFVHQRDDAIDTKHNARTEHGICVILIVALVWAGQIVAEACVTPQNDASGQLRVGSRHDVGIGCQKTCSEEIASGVRPSLTRRRA